jgi:hypothetical protein
MRKYVRASLDRFLSYGEKRPFVSQQKEPGKQRSMAEPLRKKARE